MKQLMRKLKSMSRLELIAALRMEDDREQTEAFREALLREVCARILEGQLAT